MTLYTVRYKIGGKRMTSQFLLPLADITRIVGPCTVVREEEIKRRPNAYDEEFQKEWAAIWAGYDD